MNKEFLILLNLSKEDQKTRSKLEKYLIESGANTYLKNKVLRIYDLKNKYKSQRYMIDRFIEISKRSNLKESKSLRYKRLYSYIKEIEKITEENPVRFFLELAVSLQTTNIEWIEKNIRKIINLTSLQFAVFVDPRKINDKQFAMFIQAIEQSVNLMAKNKIDPKLIKMFSSKINTYLPVKMKKSFSEKFDVNWSLNELREMVTTKSYGQQSIGFWFSILESRTTEAEVNISFSKILTKYVLNKLPESEFWIFKYFYPGGKVRKILDKRLTAFFKKKPSLHDRLLRNILLERETIQKNAIKIDRSFGKALFKLKREVYTEVLESGHPSQFSLYNLFLLGEKDPGLFWWFLL